MTKIFTNTLAAALVAASAFGASAAFAGGDYYVGGAPAPVQNQSIDRSQTNSIGTKHFVKGEGASIQQPYDRGDYRPAGINN